MDSTDKKIYENNLSVQIGKTISLWLKQNEITESVVVSATVGYPSSYVDEHGIPHSGPLIVCNVEIIDKEDFDDEDDDY